MIRAHSDPSFNESPIEARSYRILVVEDNVTESMLIKRTLMFSSLARPLEIVAAERLAEAIDLLAHVRCDLVILDLHLPDVVGLPALAALHALHPALPIVVHTGARDAKLKQDALLCGARHFVTKQNESTHYLQYVIENAIFATNSMDFHEQRQVK